MTDFSYASGNLNNTKRYKHAKKIQDEAERKYGSGNITTTGHSLGGKLAGKVGKKSNHIYTLNAPTFPTEAFSSWIWGSNDNQTDIRSKGDLVSIFAPLKNSNQISIPTTH